MAPYLTQKYESGISLLISVSTFPKMSNYSSNLYNHHLQCHLGHQSPSSSSSLDSHRHKHTETHKDTHTHTELHTPPALNQPPARPTSFCNKVLLLTVPFSAGQSDTSHRLLSGCSSCLAPLSSPYCSLCHFVSASPPRNGFTWPENEAGVSASGEWKRVCLCVFERKGEGRREINM